MTDSSGVSQAHYEYDSYGQRTKTAGALDSDFQYAGYYMHAPSGLNLTVYRAYTPAQGRWINRDPIEEDGGINLYLYCSNVPLTAVDPKGTIGILPKPSCSTNDECEQCFDDWAEKQKYCGEKYSEDVEIYGENVAKANYVRCMNNARKAFEACYAKHCK